MKRKVVNKLLALCLSVSMIAAAMSPLTVGATAPTTENQTKKEAVSEAYTEDETETETAAKETELYKVKVVLPDVSSATAVSSLSVKQNGKAYTYDSKGLKTDDKGALYLKLPANKTGETTTVTMNDVSYSGTVKSNNDNVLTKTTPDKKQTEKETEKATEGKTTEKATEKTTQPETKAETTTKAPETNGVNDVTKDTAGTDTAKLENIKIDYVSEMFTGLSADISYSIGTDGYQACPADGKLAVKEEWLGKTIHFKDADGKETTMNLANRPAAPTATTVKASGKDAADGSIQITSAGSDVYEYQSKGSSTWTTVSDKKVMGLKAGTYVVRVKAAANMFAGEKTEVNVETEVKTPSNVSVKADNKINEIYGTPQALQVELSNSGQSDATVKATLSGTDSDKFKLSTDMATVLGGSVNKDIKVTHDTLNAGTYHFSVNLVNTADSANNKTIDVVVTISKKELTVKSLTPTNRTYNGSKTVDMTLTFNESLGTTSSVKLTGEMKTADAGNGKEISEVDYTVFESKYGKNFSFNTDNIKVSNVNIAKVVLAAKVSSIESKDYDKTTTAKGKITMGPVNTSDKKIFTEEYGNGLDASAKCSYSDEIPGKNKTVTVKVSLSGDKSHNYTLEKSTLTAKGEIKKISNPNDTTTNVTAPVITKTTSNSIEFTAKTGQEYRIKGGAYGDTGSDWTTKNSFNDLKELTKYTIETRLAATDIYFVGETIGKVEKDTTRLPITAVISNNRISGVSSSYGKGSTLTFTAYGSTPNITTYVYGDERYVPVSWTSYANGQWTAPTAQMSGSFTVSNPGTYTLYVNFEKEVYNGTSWVRDSQNGQAVKDQKSVSYTVSTSTYVTPTTTNSNNNSNNNTTKSSVKTGDNSPIIVLGGLLIVSGVVLIVLFYVKRKKRVQ